MKNKKKGDTSMLQPKTQGKIDGQRSMLTQFKKSHEI